ncbi:Lysosomal Pro-X carboxypeptidase [Nymphon striatum]|nr:Lysosomal Pro-X carboxypeptidase [Nymphon striatum]
MSPSRKCDGGCGANLYDKKLDKKVKKREEMEEKRRKYILTQRKVEIEANNQRFLRDPIITLHHGYKTLHKDHTKRDLKLPNLVANSEKSGDKEINENEIINLLSPVMENEVAPGDCKHTIIATPTVYSSLTSKGNIMQSYQDVNINEIHEEIPFTKYRISTPDIAARCSNWVTELDRLSRTENRHRNKSIHFVLPAVVKDHQQFPKKEKKRHRDHKVLSIKGGPEHFKTQMMVLEEVRRVLEMEKKTNMSSVQRHTQTSNELDLDYNCGSLSSEDSVEITLKSTPTDDIPAVDTFTLNSGLGRRVEDNGDFSVGSGFRRYGDAVVVLSPVTRLEKNDILTENSVTSSGVGESCTEDVVNRNSPQYLKRRARVSNNRLHTQKEMQCMCYNFEKETNVISKEEELLECLKRLETRLQVYAFEPITEDVNKGCTHISEAVHFYAQKVDHFNPIDKRTWKQRFQLSNNSYQIGGPVLLFLNGESAIRDLDYYASTQWMLWAKKLKALVVIIDHRYYRHRIMVNVSIDNLQYLTADQALVDFARLVPQIVKMCLLPVETKWITVGGSYGGTLAAWMRYKYPHLIHTAVASSSPMKFKLKLEGK